MFLGGYIWLAINGGYIWRIGYSHKWHYLVQHEAFPFVGKPGHSLVVVLCPECPDLVRFGPDLVRYSRLKLSLLLCTIFVSKFKLAIFRIFSV